MHVHLTRNDCLEVAVLRGSVTAMQSFADSITTQRGVRYGHLHLIPEGGEELADHARAHEEAGSD